MNNFSLIFALIGLYISIELIHSAYYFKRARILANRTYMNSINLGDKSKRKFRVLIAGDSIAAGVGATEFDRSFPGLIGNYLGEKYYVELRNFSMSGSKISDLLEMNFARQKQDLIAMVISSNDLLRFTKLKRFRQETEDVLSRFSKLARKVVVTGPGNISLCPAIPGFLKPIYRHRAFRYAGILAKASGKFKNVVYVNSVSLSENPLNRYDNTHHNTVDGFHPNDKGHRFWFGLVKDYL